MKPTLDTAVEIVKQAGVIAKKEFRKQRIITQKVGGDLATDIDHRVNDVLIKTLQKAFPDYGVISEESEPLNPDREFVWIIDPIDGSKHYAQGSPHYSLSLALQRNGAICMGIVYSPQSEELFSAIENGGAFLNNTPIACGQKSDLKKAMLCVEIPSRHAPEQTLRIASERLGKVIKNCQRVRIIGVSSLGLCYCACGAFDGYVNLGSFPNELWDYAGGEILLKESGGTISRKDHVTIAGNDAIHQSIRAIIFEDE